jgi:hypothetical protein
MIHAMHGSIIALQDWYQPRRITLVLDRCVLCADCLSVRVLCQNQPVMTEVGPGVLQGVARVLHKYPFVYILVRT